MLTLSFDRPMTLRAAVICFAIISFLSVLPLVFTTIPPLHDYPFHLARIHILDHWHESPYFQSWYDLNSFVLPNVAMDIVVLALAQILPLEVAGRVFVATTLILMLGGCVFLYRSLNGNVTLWPFVSCFFLFNWILLWGFMNYLFGCALMLWGLGGWIATSDSAVWRRWLIGTVFATALFFCHLIALGLFALGVAGFELQRSLKTVRADLARAVRDLAVGASIFTIPILLYWGSRTAEAPAGEIKWYLPWARMKLFAAWHSLMSANWLVDAPLVAGAVLLIPAALFLGKIQLKKCMFLPLVVYVLAYLIMPGHLIGVVLVDIRLPLVITLVAIASTRLRLPAGRWQTALVCLMTAFLIVRSMALSFDWHRSAKIIEEFKPALAQLPPGSILFTGSEGHGPSFWHDVRERASWKPPLQHVGALATIYQNIFVPSIWAHQQRQPIRLKPMYQNIHRFQHFNPIKYSQVKTRTGVYMHLARLTAELEKPVPPAFILVTYPSLGFEGLWVVYQFNPRFMIAPINKRARLYVRRKVELDP